LKLGFNIQAKKYSVLISSIPTELASCDVQDTISTMINRIKDGQGNAKLTRDILFEKALYQASCKAAVKAGREYPKEYVEWIVDKLMELPDVTVCPHGRPVAMEISRKNLERQFGRA
jgi:DNA mismatch repair protein MutL